MNGGDGCGGGGEMNVKIKSHRNLKCLEVTGSSDEDARLISWTNFIQGFPNLEVLGAQCRFSEDLTQLLSALLVTPSPLKKLSDFSCVLIDLHNSHLEMLSSLDDDVNFHSLDLSLSEEIDPYYLLTLLKNHASTLKNLKLFRDSEKPLTCLSSSILSVPLYALATLELQCNMIESLDFVHGLTPNLKTLNLTQFGEEEVFYHNSIVRNTKSTTLPFLSLHSFFFEYFLAPDCLERICKLFPHLVRLSTYLTDESVRVIFQDLQNLQELTVLGTKLSDEGLTGVPLHVLERKYRFMKDYRKFPYIGNLTKLWRFVLYPQPQEKITDYSVTHGFLDATNLSSMEIPETAISNKAIEILQQKSNLVTLTSPFYARSGNLYNRPGDLQELRTMTEE